MPPRSPLPTPCPHEIRPGTTVCLHCRQAERLATSERRRRTAARVGLALTTLAVCAVVANAAVGAFGLPLPRLATRPHGEAHSASPAADASVRAPAHDSAAPIYGATDAVAPGSVARPTAAAPAIAPIVAEGRSTLRAPAVAVRAGDVVTVQFDAPETRTRRADKFESIVRVTLPEIYGAAADSALAHVPAGALVSASELVTELPTRGVRLPVGAPAAGAIMLWPETRPGRDGPLVVNYRVTIVP